MSNTRDTSIYGYQAVKVADYPTLRNYTGNSASAYVYGTGISGNFTYDSTDTVSVDNGGTIIVDSLNRRWKRQVTNGLLPIWFGARGDGVTDDTAAIQATLNAGLYVVFGDSNTKYKISSALILNNGHQLYFNGATVQQYSALTAMFNYSGKSNILITGGNFIGLGVDFNNSPSSQACGTIGSGCSNIRIIGNKFTNFSCASISVTNSTDIWVENNTIIGPGNPVLTVSTSGACYGVLIDAGSSKATVTRNHISQTAQGIATGNGVSQVEMSENTIFNISGQHGIYAGAGQIDLTISGNIVYNIPLIGMKVQNYDTPSMASNNISVYGNNIDTCGGNGISVYSTATLPAQYLTTNINVVDNTVTNIGQDGISIGAVTTGVVADNTVTNCTRQALTYSQCTNVKFSKVPFK